MIMAIVSVFFGIMGIGLFFLSGTLIEQGQFGDEVLSITKVLIMLSYGSGGAILGLFLGSMGIITRQQQAKIIECLGKFSSVNHAGFSLKPPTPFGKVAGSLSLKIEQLSAEISVKSKDNAFLRIPVKVQIKVKQNKVKEAFYELRDAGKQIMAYVENFMRAKANSMEMDHIFSSKNEFKDEVEEHLKDKFERFGWEIVDVLVDDPQPSEELRKAFDKVLAAKRDQEASLLEKEAIKNRIVGKAEAEAESLKLKAVAYVDMRKTMAAGNAHAIKEFCGGDGGLDISHSEALAYFAGLDSRDAIRDASQGKGSVIVIPAAGLDGASQIGRVAALTKALHNVKEGDEPVAK